ncbi:hypothetical protein JW979_11425, partial [bacterium]|nr:hypothetical protein [candidate division CSSED10-310 bacterium]
MKSINNHISLFCGIVSLMLFTSALAETETTQNITKVNDPGRLFTIPTAKVLPLGSLSLGGGRAFGKLGSNFFGRMGFGIAPYTE